MKSVLVIDTPKTCKECPCQLMFVCVPTDEDIDEYVYPNETKSDRCPLRPFPETKDVGYPIDDYAVGFSDGWDACLKEITK